MDSDDDEILLLKQPESKESDSEGTVNPEYQHQASVNPGFVFQHRHIIEDGSVVDPGTVYALQTAFTSLQKRHNDLLQKYKLVQKWSLGTTEQKTMDTPLASNAAAGAGGSHDEEATTAEIRAKQGYIQHLEKELLRSNNSLAKGNEEIMRLKELLSEMDISRQKLIKEHDGLKVTINALTETLDQVKANCAEKDDRVQQLQEEINTSKFHNQELLQETKELKRQLEYSNHTGLIVSNKEKEIQELQAKLYSLETETKKYKSQTRDLQIRFNEKEREISALEAKHKQYAIENDINRKQVQAQRETDSLDEVDGETEMIMEAFEMVKTQQETIKELKNKVDHQKIIINELRKTKGHKAIPDSSAPDPHKEMDERGTAQGESFTPQYEEKPLAYIPTYENTKDCLQPKSPDLSFNTRRQMSPKLRHSQPINDLRDEKVIENEPQRAINKVTDMVKPTGDRMIPKMRASEHAQSAVRVGGFNVFDAPQNSNAPALNVQNDLSDLKRLSVVEKNVSPRITRNSSPEYTPIEPVGILTNNRSVNYGARPRVQPSSVTHRNFQPSDAQISQARLPERMTQSEIIIRDRLPTDQSYTENQHIYPGAHGENANMSRSHGYISMQGQTNDVSRHVSDRQPNQHDYENVYQPTGERETESPNNDYDHSIYVNDTSLTMQNRIAVEQAQKDEQTNSVSAVKICPVCNIEFSRLSMVQFQTHVFECFDNCDDPPVTLQPSSNNIPSEEERTCPMCGASFPLTIPQETFEQHVLAHFGEEPLLDRFEMIN